MIKVICFSLMMLFASQAMAEWIKASETDAYVEYIDLSTVQKYGNVVKMWSLVDYKNNNHNGYYFLSSKLLHQYDCQERTSLSLTTVDYTGNMGEGDVVESYDFNDAKPHNIVPGTIGETLWKVACDRL